jgi:hypothetical protein
MRTPRAGHDQQRVLLARIFLRLQQAVTILLGIAEFEGIFRLDAVGQIDHALGVQEALQALTGPDPHVMAALGTHVQIALQLGAIEHRVAGCAFDPQPLRHRARPALGLDPRGHDFFEPGHWRLMLKSGKRIYTRSGCRGQAAGRGRPPVTAGSLESCRDPPAARRRAVARCQR